MDETTAKSRTSKSKSRIDAFYETEEKAHQKVNREEMKLDMQMTRLGKDHRNEKCVQTIWDKVILKDFSHLLVARIKSVLLVKWSREDYF